MPMATISGNQKVAVAQASTTMPSMNGARRSIRGEAARAPRRFEPASTVMATAPAAIHAGRVGFGGLELGEGPAQEDHRHDDQVEDETEGERGDEREGEEVAGVAAEEQGAEHDDGLGGDGEQEPGAVDPLARPGLGPLSTTAKSVA